ncbi:MAG: HepT-like ribonuclease domain-containing protein [Methylovirgula sp.]
MSVLQRRLMPSMPSSSAATPLRDILYHIDLAKHFVVGLEYPAFRDDMRTIYAVIRCLEIISEASRRLPDGLKARHPSIAWQQMAAAGNIYRHEYEDVAAHYVWDTVQRDLSSLRKVIEQELS